MGPQDHRAAVADRVAWPSFTSPTWRRLLTPLLVACQAGTVLLTWPLWQSRDLPPELPAVVGSPSWDTGWLVVATLLLVLVRPRLGAAAHVLVLSGVILLDQSRLQPQIVSLALLIVASTDDRLAVVGRAHLVTLWVWAGVHKLLSTGFATGDAAFIAEGLRLPVAVVAIAVPLTEVSLGLLALAPRTHHLARPLAVVVHAMILIALVAQDWNSSVWLWNIAVPVAAWGFLRGDRTPAPATLPDRVHGPRIAALAAVVWAAAWLYPAGFYVGAVDAYLAHNLYTSNTHLAAVCQPPAGSAPARTCDAEFDLTWQLLNVPLPPETRLFRSWFEGTCTGREVLVVSPIASRLTRHHQQQTFTCPN